MLQLLANVGKNTLKLLRQNKTTVATMIAIGGVCYTAYSSGKSAVKASKKLEQMHYESEEEPTTKEKFKAVAPIFIKPVCVAGLTIGCIAWAQSKNLKKQAALVTAYSFVATSKEEFEEKAKEIVGKGKVRKIKDEIAKDTLAAHPVVEDAIINTGNGNVLYFDKHSNMYFYSSEQAIRKAENTIIKRLASEVFIELNDFYYELGLPYNSLAEGLGFSLTYGKPLDVDISTQLTPVSSIPCGVIDYETSYVYDRE